MTLIEQTSAMCPQCSQSHPAEIVREGNCIVAITHCPKGEIRIEISSDADLFLAMRTKSQACLPTSVPCDAPRSLLNYISITNACDMRCAVCFAGAVTDPRQAVFLSVDEIMRRAEMAWEAGGRILYLFGGEPTMHPELMTIVEKLSHRGFRLNMVTNGVRLGREKGLARELKKRGLAKVSISIDALNSETLATFGRCSLEEKKAAIKNAINVGFNVALNCVVTNVNIGEIGKLIAYAADLGGSLHNIQFNSAVPSPVGRITDALADSPDRERIVRAILAEGGNHGFSEQDVWPMPFYAPWGLRVHADCGVAIFLLRTAKGLIPLSCLLDMGAFYARLARCRLRPSFFSIWVIPFLFALASIRTGCRWQALRMFAGFVLNRKQHSFLTISVSNFKIASFLNEKRLKGCSTRFITSHGPVEGCLHFTMDRNFPGSKASENAAGFC